MKIKKKKKQIKETPKGRAYISSSYNNTIITITDANGNVLDWSSAGRVGFRGPKKATPFAAGIMVKDLAERIRPYQLKELEVFLKGLGTGRESAVRSLNANGFFIKSIKDITPTPHNGCRAPKPRRV